MSGVGSALDLGSFHRRVELSHLVIFALFQHHTASLHILDCCFLSSINTQVSVKVFRSLFKPPVCFLIVKFQAFFVCFLDSHHLSDNGVCKYFPTLWLALELSVSGVCV